MNDTTAPAVTVEPVIQENNRRRSVAGYVGIVKLPDAEPVQCHDINLWAPAPGHRTPAAAKACAAKLIRKGAAK